MKRLYLPKPTRAKISFEALTNPNVSSVEQNGKYLHWDELRHRPKPGLVTHEVWWSLIKIARNHVQKATPLKDETGRSFTFAMTDSMQRLVHEIDRDASGRIELPEEVTNLSTRDRYVFNSLAEEAIRSSQLEGASTTRAVAKELIRSKRPPRTTGERMILNNFHAMEWVRDHRDESFSVDRVLELHSLVTRDTLDSNGIGRFRRPDEEINVVDPRDGEVDHTPPNAALLPSRMDAMCRFANSSTDDGAFIHPVVRAILVHLWLAYDHPFVDGNGRTARALFYWSMLKQGYWLTEFLSISRVIKNARAQYDRAFLYTESDDNDATYFVLNQLDVIVTAIADLFAYLKKKTREVRDVENKLRGRDDLNHRQLVVLTEALRHSNLRLTVEAHLKTHNIVYETARTDLLGLVKRGYLEQAKIGKKLVFTAAQDLDRKLTSTR